MYEGWTKDPEIAKLYLLESCKLDPKRKYGFYFEDGTGYIGTPTEFIPYLIRRFAKMPDDSFEIDYDESLTAGASGELYIAAHK